MFWSCGPSLRPPSGPGARYMLRSPTEKGFIQTNGRMQNGRVLPPLRCNPNGNLALRGDKSYDLKRPSSVYVSLSRLKKGEEGCEEQDLKSEDQDRSLTAFSRDDINRSSGPSRTSRGTKGRLFPKSSSFYRPAFDISWPPISSYWT